MKINWGVFAFSLFGVFVVFMLVLVYFATQQNNELVTENYYEKELAFKDVLTKKENTNNLKEQVKLNVLDKNLELVFPTEITNKIFGQITFYKPSDEKADQVFDINTTENKQLFELTSFQKGMYRVKVDWKANNVDYFNEISVVIP